jgi:drug/metabolite transporter (DMT)-like permease
VDSLFPIAVAAGIGGMLGWGLADFFAKKTIDEIGDVATLVLAHLFGTAVFFGLILFRASLHGLHAVVIGPPVLVGLAFFGVLQAVVYILVYRGFAKGQLSILNPLFASFSGLTALLSVFFFGEALTGHLAAALATVFLGVILLNLDIDALKAKRPSVRVPGFAEVATATGLAAGWTILWNRFVHGQDWLLYAAGMYSFMTVALLLYAAFMRVKFANHRLGVWVYLALIGACETLAYAAVSWGYGATSHTSVVALLSGAFSLPTIVLARLFLKERTTRLQALASLIIVSGIVFLNVG